jgi:hypothetical protein
MTDPMTSPSMGVGKRTRNDCGSRKPQNATGDIYWVDAKVIKDLEPTELN